MEKSAIIHKNLGETPLLALERFRAENNYEQNVPMTYAGRLDPMAEGELLILIGDECKNKEIYLGLDKEYEIEVLFGMTTDTQDILGLINTDPKISSDPLNKKILREFDETKYVVKFVQEYPIYSSKTIGGKQMHELARKGELPESDEIPSKQVEIYTIENWGYQYVYKEELEDRILNNIDLVKGDFRQDEIKKRWVEYFADPNVDEKFNILRLKVKCSSGTYMRKLAEKIGDDKGMGAIAFSINRTHIYL